MHEQLRLDLTSREIEVLTLSRELHTSREVAKMINTSKRTVDFHLGNIYAKLGVNNKLAAIFKAEDRGIIPARDHV